MSISVQFFFPCHTETFLGGSSVLRPPLVGTTVNASVLLFPPVPFQQCMIIYFALTIPFLLAARLRLCAGGVLCRVYLATAAGKTLVYNHARENTTQCRDNAAFAFTSD